MKKPTLVLFCGLPGSGKTTLAQKLSKDLGIIRLNSDEWMANLGFDPMNEKMHTQVQTGLWKVVKELLISGQNVIVENGLWTRKERDEKRETAHELGVLTELHYLNVPLDELIRRLEIRNASNTSGVAIIDRKTIERYSKIFESPDDSELALFNKTIVHNS
jgi:predicted kinase